ncbi:M23 family metallopeptidase [Microbacterium proteolyticum]|uniref:M23 family metallopeptidase n=1 Tax=Microbacterium proteolyticum TaxID=1572644 RepID=UPI0024180C34|nr:M23 family metallopeptidase [Microbacterium proteolyticum]
MRTRFTGRLSRMSASIAVLLLALGTTAADAAERDPLADRGWAWPVAVVRVVRPFEAPPGPYAAGHRGVDLGDVERVRSPAPGRVAFAGEVAGRPVVTIDHGDGLVTTFEPVTTVLGVGDPVARGDPIGEVAAGGHVAGGAVHFGVRWNGEYVNPLRLLGGVPRAVLLACC